VPFLLQLRKRPPEQLPQARRIDGVQQIADLVVARDFFHPKQALRIVLPLVQPHLPLVRQK
jgi:hypothetical protein